MIRRMPLKWKLSTLHVDMLDFISFSPTYAFQLPLPYIFSSRGVPETRTFGNGFDSRH
jgi:hypothetical protein